MSNAGTENLGIVSWLAVATSQPTFWFGTGERGESWRQVGVRQRGMVTQVIRYVWHETEEMGDP